MDYRKSSAQGCFKSICSTLLMVSALTVATNTMAVPADTAPARTTAQVTAAPAPQANQDTPKNSSTNTQNQLSAPFSTKLPADFERCQRTSEINRYLDQIAKTNVSELTELKLFLLSCKELLQQRITDTQNKIHALKSASNIANERKTAEQAQPGT